jgi:NAD(P)H-nitrite reductase large subunit
VTTHVVIGTGIAGLSAVETLRRRDPQARVVMLGSEPHRFYSRPALAYLLADSIPEQQLYIRDEADVRDLGVEIYIDPVVRIDPAAHTVTTASGVLAYDRLLLATGATAIAPDFAGGELDGVMRLDGLDDARAILARAKKAKAAVVVGGGPTALELADGLRARGLDVHYLMRGPRYWASVLEPAESQAVEDALAREGIDVHPRTQIARVVGDRGRVVAVETDAGDRIGCELVAVAIGVRPRVELARAAGLAIDRGVLTDEYLRTSAPDVFAAGDVAQIRDPATGASHLDVLWSAAMASGRAAARCMAGVWKPYRRPASLNVTKLGGIIVTVIGAVGAGGADDDLVTIARGDSEAWRARPRAWTVEHHRDACRIRVVVDASRVVGAVVMGDPGASRALCRLIEERVDIRAIRPTIERDPEVAIDALIELGEDAPARDADA